MLSKSKFKNVVKYSPLVAVDFIILNNKHEVLLGLRNNNPAKGLYFTLGGILTKNEKIEDAIKRVSKNEFGVELQLKDCKFNNVFEQIYDNNFLDNNDFGTHYIALSYIYIDKSGKINPQIINKINKYSNQHKKFIWLDINKLLNDKTIHPAVREMVRNSINHLNS